MEPISQDPSPRLLGGSQTIRAESGGGGEAAAGVWTGPAHQGAGQPGRRQPLRTPPTSPPLLSLPTSYSAGPPVVQVRALRGRCGRSLSSSLPLQVPLFFPSAGSADPQHPWAPRPWRQSQQLFRPFNSSRGCRNSNCCIAHSGSALLMRL